MMNVVTLPGAGRDEEILGSLDALAREGAPRMIAAALRFNSHHLVADVLDGIRFKDGIRVTDNDNHDDGMTDEKVAA